MSHIPGRKEKDCLNCGTIVHGRYCHNCGQENVLPKESFWHMVIHFLYDITHFDSKFFETVKDLLFKPGFLSREYMMGRRASYLHPVKMYVFTSAMFFLLFFSLFSADGGIKSDFNKVMTPQEREKQIVEVEKDIKKHPDKVYLQKQMELLKDTTRPLTIGQLLYLEEDFTVISFSGKTHRSVEAYDSLQSSLPIEKRDNWFMKRLRKKEIEINQKYRTDPEAALKKLGNTILHKLPYMLFVSLPLFALLLKLVYIRRKDFYYADHIIFTLHLYIFSFILLAIVFCLNKLDEILNSGFIGFVIAVLVFGLFFYLYKAMRNFYKQRRAKTLFKFLLIALSSFIMMLILLVIFIFFSAFTL